MKQLRFLSGKSLNEVQDQFNKLSAEKGIEKYVELKCLNGEYVLSVIYDDNPEYALEHDVFFADLYKSGDISTRLFNVLRILNIESVNAVNGMKGEPGITIRDLKKTKDCGNRTIEELRELLKSYGVKLRY